MAVDTRNKRMSLLSLSLPKSRVFPNPDGGFTTAAERAHLAYLYAFGAAAPPTTFKAAWAVNANQIVSYYGELE